MSKKVSIDEMAAAINEGLEEYANLSAQGVKSAVRKTSKAVKEQINGSAPVRTGRYAKSWAVKTTAESSQSLEQTVYSPSPLCCPTFWRRGMPSGAAAVSGPFPISRLRRRWALKCWKV